MWAEVFADLLSDHDLLLIDPRGGGRSHPIRCGVTALPATRKGFVRAIERCGKRLGRQARAYTAAATADDLEAVRKHLGIPKLDLYGVSTGTYLMTVFAQRHPRSVRSIVLSSAFPLRFDMWGRAERARPPPGDPARLRALDDRQVQRRPHPAPARPARPAPAGPPDPLPAERPAARLDDTTLAGIAYQAGANGVIGQIPAVVRAALRGDTGR